VKANVFYAGLQVYRKNDRRLNIYWFTNNEEKNIVRLEMK